MDLQIAKTKKVCPRAEIAAYLDGELSPSDELILEQHFAICKTCLDELNLQKKLLSALDFAFESKSEIELPENFTKVVVAKAESRVSGLRSKKERIWALSICAGVLFLTMLGIALESDQILYSLSDFGKQFLALAGFINHLIFDITIGLAVILRFLSQQIVFSSGFATLLFLCVIALGFLSFSRLVLKFSRS
ncbi:MAG: zf-HC2 domain-containing protein [Pyrinomonadaceae bacterium]|nr:zf-HC2 domain-containing protein [Pyrinomonadaceae bacterium]